MLLSRRISGINIRRTFKNFGHKREPIPTITTLWHGFLTFGFISACLDWDKIRSWIFPSKELEDVNVSNTKT